MMVLLFHVQLVMMSSHKQILVGFLDPVDINEMVNGKQFHNRENKKKESGGRQTKMIQHMSLRTLFLRIEPRNPIPFQTINQQGILFPM